MKTLLVVLFIHFAAVQSESGEQYENSPPPPPTPYPPLPDYGYTVRNEAKCYDAAAAKYLFGYHVTDDQCRRKCSSESTCQGYNINTGGSQECYIITSAVPTTGCIIGAFGASGWKTYTRAASAPPPPSGGNCFLYYRQAEVLTAATDTSGNQYCVMPGAEGNDLKCSDHYGFGTRHCDCETTLYFLENLICNRCDPEMTATCKKHVGYCRQQHCTDTYADTDYQKAAQQWSLTECLYTKYTCIKDSILAPYNLDVDHRRICPGVTTEVWDSTDTAHIDDASEDSCEDATKAPDNGRTQSAWWAVPRPYKVIERRSCSHNAGSGKITGGTYYATQFGDNYYAALPGCARACDMDNTCDGFRLGTKDHSSMPGQCMLFKATSDADNFENLVTTHCTASDQQDMYIKTETSPSPPPTAVSPPPPSPPPPTSSCKGSGTACVLNIECCDGSCDCNEFGGCTC